MPSFLSLNPLAWHGTSARNRKPKNFEKLHGVSKMNVHQDEKASGLHLAL